MSERRQRRPEAALRRYAPEAEAPADGPVEEPRAAALHEDVGVRPNKAGGERRAPMATPRRLGESLLLARQAKGVDLERAARDTKIRAKYLAALEADDFRELPGTVYTKGFLHNYAQYLGLDPDTVVAHFKREVGSRAGERVSVVLKTLEAPRAGFTLSRGLFVAVILTLLVVAFAGYVGMQVLRYARPPELAVTRPTTVESTVDADSTTLAGTASAGATVTVTGPSGPANTTAGPDGAWSIDVPLSKGQNEFLVVALDPVTGKKSDQLDLIVTVPTPPPAEAPVLSLSSPADGTTFTNGAIPIKGTTNGDTVSVAATYLGPPTGAPAGGPTPAPPTAQGMTVSGDGGFDGSYTLTAGSWRLTVTATGEGQQQTALTRTITVAYTGINLVLEIKGGRAWLVVRLDGQYSDKTTSNGVTLSDRTTLRFTAKNEIWIWTGAASVTYVTVNGVSYGPLGSQASPGKWTIGPTGPPQPA